MLDTSKFKSHGLDEQDSASLMHRNEVKFMLPVSALVDCLDLLSSNYTVLEINGKRNFHYLSNYFDTESFEFYRAHHNGKANRYKIRIRHYVDSLLSFLEVKYKDVKGRTHKYRIPIEQGCQTYREFEKHKEREADNFVQRFIGQTFSQLTPILNIGYHRVTLLGMNVEERVTIDTNLYFSDRGTGDSKCLCKTAIVEIKRKNGLKDSVAYQLFRSRNFRTTSCSKYCLGMALSREQDVKMNRFKPILQRLDRIEGLTSLKTQNGQKGLAGYDKHSVQNRLPYHYSLLSRQAKSSNKLSVIGSYYEQY
ncbi:MAG: polyphosphate polymerase domain-containing protein [Gammaproteobacteria bacterium]|nr:polyphosphate polymerase domain-containing protein [Gammaproteobacteria bacterium]